MARIVLIEGKKPILHEHAIAILFICLHIPREKNQFADYFSRVGDVGDWMLISEVFQELDAGWAPHTIDRFADEYNSQLKRFNSSYWSLGTEAINIFTCDWERENN